jgi:MFS family permease
MSVVRGLTGFKLFAPLRIRDFRLLWIGMTVSLLGDGIFLVALALQVYELSNVPSALATIGVALTIPHVLFLLAGGVVSDRFDRRKVMIAADAVRGCALAAMGILSLTGGLELGHIIAIGAVYGAGSAFFGPAFDAIVPDVVPGELLEQANSLDQFVRPAGLRMAGPAIGGFIAAWSLGGAFLIDSATFGISILAVALMRPRPLASEGADAAQRPSAVGEIREGFRYVRSQVWLWGTFLAATIAYLLFYGSSEVLLPYIVKNVFEGGAKELGLIHAVGGIGAILAAVVVASRGVPRRHMTFMYVAWTLSTLAIAGYGLARFPWQAMLTSFAFNGLEAAGTIAWATAKQRHVPRRLLGRVSSFDWFISIALVPLSFALTGPVAGAIGARTTLVCAAVLGAVVTFAFLFLPGMRGIEERGVVGAEPFPSPAPGEAAAPESTEPARAKSA